MRRLDERLFTLLSRDGEIPDEKTQAEYRRAQVKAWKKSMENSTSRKGKKYTETSGMQAASDMSDMEITDRDDAGHVTYTFTFTSAHGHFPLVGDFPAMRRTYVLDTTRNTVVHQTHTHLEPWTLLGTVQLEIWDMSADFILIDPELPPFPSNTKVHFHIRAFGVDRGEREIETVYSDYRRVKCYDERFRVKIGAPSMSDFMPTN